MPARGDLRRLLVAFLLLAPAAGAAEERPRAVLPGESKATASRIAEADRRFADGKWAEGLDELQAVLDGAGDDLVPVDAAHSVRARRLVHARVARLPPAALKSYRDRVDARAGRWLEQGIAARDEVLLRKVADEAFCSRPGERALELLGDAAFERGRFAEAEAWWRLLAPPDDAPTATDHLAYPDPRGDVDRVRAKRLMALHFQGVPSARLLDEYRTRHGSAGGVLGGRKGTYGAFLADLFAEPAPGGGDPTWTTFGGDATRGRVQPAPPRLLDRLSILCRGGPAWRVGLPSFEPLPESATSPDEVEPRARYARSLTLHPLIAGGKLLAADDSYVYTFDLRTGTRSELYHLRLPAAPPPEPRIALPGIDWRPGIRARAPAAAPPPHDERHTLTVAEGCVYARLGRPGPGGFAFGRGGDGPGDESALVCLSLNPAPGERPLRWLERGLAGANAAKRGRVVFGGPPVVRDGRVLAAATRVEDGFTVRAVHCYAAEPPAAVPGGGTAEPVLLWHADVCRVTESAAGPRYRHRLLTLAGPLVVCGPYDGALTALDAETGRPAWAARYPVRDPGFDDRARHADPTPCVYADGRVFAAPADGEGLFCLDAETGRRLWSRHGVDVVDLLGVGGGRLIFTTPTGLRAVDAKDGGDGNGWSHEARTDYGKDGARSGWTPAGRGFLAGDYVFWPTIDAAGGAHVYAVRQEDGEPDDNPTLLHQVPVGNLVYAEGCLAVAGRNELSIFTPPAWHLPERERGATLAPSSAGAALALARAEADAGFFERAAASYARAESLAGRGRGTARRARAERRQTWLDAGRRAVEGKRWAEAKEAFGRAAATEFAPAERASALLEAARVWEGAGRPDEAAAARHALLESGELRRVRLRDGTSAARAAADQPAAAERPTIADQQQVPAGAPGLALPLQVSRDVTLDPAEELLPSPGGDAFLTACRGTPPVLVCRDAGTAQPRWRSPLPFFPCWAAWGKDQLVVAGNGGVAALRRVDGVRNWSFSPSGEESGEPLTGFRRANGRLLFLEGGHLLALDLGSGEPVWQIAAPLAGVHPPPPAGRFVPYFFAGETGVLLQAGSGLRLALQTDAGGRTDESPGAGPWTSDPVARGGDVVAVEGTRRVVCLRGCGLEERWAYTVPGVSLLTARPPRVGLIGDALLLLVETNIGYELQRLDRDTGRPLWPVPVLLRDPAPDPADWAAGDRAVCLVERGVLTARSLEDGRRLWETLVDEPGRAWRVERLANGLLAYPAALTARRFAFRWLTGRLQWSVVPDAGEAIGRGFPVVCCDTAGRVLQRFGLAAGAPALRPDPDPPGGLPVVPRAAVWRGTAAGCPPVQVTARGVVVVVGHRAWCLAPAAAK